MKSSILHVVSQDTAFVFEKRMRVHYASVKSAPFSVRLSMKILSIEL